MKDIIFQLEFAHEAPDGSGYYYDGLTLPAEDYEIRDALQKARLTSSHHGVYDISIVDSFCLPSLTDIRLDSPTIDELNFLAKRIQEMDTNTRRVYEAVIQKALRDEPVSLKDLINCTYGLEKVTVASHVTDDAQLGAFIMENGLLSGIEAIPEGSRYLLDREKIGEMYRTACGAKYMPGLCVFTNDHEMPEIYDGRQLPEASLSTWFAFRLLVAAPPMEDEVPNQAEWISLPLDKQEADRVAQLHGAKRIEDCVYYDFESSIPQITTEMLTGMGDFDRLNRLSGMMAEMSPADQVKFKAALEADKPTDIPSVLDIAEHLHQYEMDAAVSYDRDYFRAYLIHHLDDRFDTQWLNKLGVRDEGVRLLARQGATITDYGVISARGGSLYAPVPYSQEIREQDTGQPIEASAAQTGDDWEEAQGMELTM